MKKLAGRCRWVSAISKTIVFEVKQKVQDSHFGKCFKLKKVLQANSFVVLMAVPSIAASSTLDWCSGTWSLSNGSYVSSTPNGTNISLSYSAQSPAKWSFSPNGAMNAAGVFSDSAISGANSLSLLMYWDDDPENGRLDRAAVDGGIGNLTLDFNHRVINPVIHIDRIGGWGGLLAESPQTLANSAVITPHSSSSANFEKIAGVDHFVVTPTSVNRLIDQELLYLQEQSEAAPNGSINTAMGSMQANIVDTSLSLDFSGGGVEGAGFDGIEFVICSMPYDLSDLPVTGVSPNGLSSNEYGEAKHAIVNGFYLGADEPDHEFEPQTGQQANGDDNDGNNDDDGIVGLDYLIRGTTATLTADVAGAGGYLQGWIDFNGNGRFDSDEQIASNLQDGAELDTDGLSNGQIVFAVEIPETAIKASTFARFRWSTENDLDAVSDADNGEVEDYAVELRGYILKGRVFNDSNVDGLNEGDESGISNLPIVLRDVVNNICVSTRTRADGNYTFYGIESGDYQLYEASQETVPVPRQCDSGKAKDPAAYLSTTANVLPMFTVADQDISGKDFGDINPPTFLPDNSGNVLPDNVIFYGHRLTAKSAGVLSFSVNNQSGGTEGWTGTLYQDSNCNGELDTGEGDAPISDPFSVVAGDIICVLNKVYAPSQVYAGEKFTTEIAALFDFENSFAGTKSLFVMDITKVSAKDNKGSSRLELKKTVENISQGTAETDTLNQAKPGDVLKYRIYYSNTGTAPLSDLVIRDAVPEYTRMLGMPVCNTPLPSSLSNCTPDVNAMNIEWRFPDNDELQAGNSGVVSFEVIVEN